MGVLEHDEHRPSHECFEQLGHDGGETMAPELELELGGLRRLGRVYPDDGAHERRPGDEPGCDGCQSGRETFGARRVFALLVEKSNPRTRARSTT